MSMIQIEPGAARVIGLLRAAGYPAYAVGGCVRDALLGDTPSDWDICTAARPEQTIAVFGESRCIPTGIRHGTITVRMDGGLYEVTTFRTESGYSDGRHPDAVTFMDDVRADLARRDFTINAMAYGGEEGLVDPFGGREDLFAHRLVRAVGEPMVRFEEDALRILRMLRFAARFSFAMDRATLCAAKRLSGNMCRVSAERIREEIIKLLLAPAPGAYMPQEILFAAVPQLARLSQEEWQRTLRAVNAAPREEALRLAALTHALGEAGARETMKALKCSREQIAKVCALVGGLAMTIGETAEERRFQARRLVGEYGIKYVKQLAQLSKAAQTENRDAIDALLACAREVSRQGLCCRMAELAVSGGELMEALGLRPGREIGALLSWLLDQVMRERIPNERQALIFAAKAHARERKNVL